MATSEQRQELRKLRGAAGREEVLRRLIAATERLLEDRQPFADITIEQLAAEAGIARSTFYMHFRDRGAFVQEIGSSLIEDFAGVVAGLLALGPGPTREDLAKVMHSLLEAWRPHEHLVPPILETLPQSPELRRAYEQGLTRVAAVFEAFIRQQPRELVRDRDPQYLSTVLTHMCEQTIAQEVTGANADRRARIAQALADVCWNAIFRDRDA